MRFSIFLLCVKLLLHELVYGEVLSSDSASSYSDAQSGPVSALVTLEQLRERLDFHQRSSCHAAARQALFATQHDSSSSPSPWSSDIKLGASTQGQLGSGFSSGLGNDHGVKAVPLQCSGECSKLHIALALAQCVLKHTSQSPIPCGSDAIVSTSSSRGVSGGTSCILRPGCLTAASAADVAATPPPSYASKSQEKLASFFSGGTEHVHHNQQPQDNIPHFNVPTQQSIVFSEAYQHVESLCSYLALSSLMNANVDLARASRGAALETLTVAKAAAAYGQEERAAMRELGLRVGDTLTAAEGAKQVAQQTLQTSSQTLVATERSAAVLENVRDTALTNQELLHEANHRLEDSVSFSLELLDLAEKSFKMVAALAHVLQVAERSAGRVAKVLGALLALLLLRAVLNLLRVATWVVTRGPLSWAWWLPLAATQCIFKAWLALIAAAAPTLVSTLALVLPYRKSRIVLKENGSNGVNVVALASDSVNGGLLLQQQQQLQNGGDDGSGFPWSDVDEDAGSVQGFGDDDNNDDEDNCEIVRTPPLASARVILTPMSNVSEEANEPTSRLRSSRAFFDSSHRSGSSSGSTENSDEACRVNLLASPNATTSSAAPTQGVASPLMEQRLLAALAAHEARAAAGQRQFREATFQAAFRAAHADAEAQLSNWKQEASRLLASERQARKRLMDDLSSQLNTANNNTSPTSAYRTPSTAKRPKKSHKKRRTSLQS